MRQKVGRKVTRTRNEDSRALNNLAAQVEGPQRKKKWSSHDLKVVRPLTENQKTLFQLYYQGDHVCSHGSAGTGKSFLGCFLAISDVLNPDRDQEQVIIVRSAVQSRNQGFMPGSLDEKQAYFETPYESIFAELFGRGSTYSDMKEAGLISFMTTSFIRGVTWDNAIIVVDEAQNMDAAELDTIMTRVGKNSRIILCGDTQHQCDLQRGEKSGLKAVLNITKHMDNFSSVEFGHEDIVRSGFVKQWIIARDQYNNK